MKTLKVLLQEVVSGIKAWVNSNFAQESNAVHKTGDETVNGSKLFTAYVQVNNRIAYQDTSVIDKTGSDVYRAVDTYAHQGGDGSYWGGLKHLWFADGQSTLQLAVANHKLNGSTWNQGFWAINLGASKDFSSVYFAPSNNNAINLGTANYQWKNVYAKNYYYNGTPWGLDKANEWTGTNTFVGNIGLVTYKSDGIDRTQHTDSNYRFVTQIAQDKNGKKMGECYWGYKASTDEAVASFWVTASDGLDNDTSHRGGIYIFHNGNTGITDVHPAHLNGTNLGTSANKWKSFNGINPGALSLPVTDSVNRIELQTEETEWVKDGTVNTYTPTLTGWLNIRIGDVAGDFILAQSGRITVSAPGTGNITATNVGLSVLIPVVEGESCDIYVKTTTVHAFIYPCRGNVP